MAYQTVRCSALNAEELRREGGLESFLEAISRCIPMIGASSKLEDVAVQVDFSKFPLFLTKLTVFVLLRFACMLPDVWR